MLKRVLTTYVLVEKYEKVSEYDQKIPQSPTADHEKEPSLFTVTRHP